jgi:hypothetical protein
MNGSRKQFHSKGTIYSMSLNNIKLNASPDSKSLASSLESKLIHVLDETCVRALFEKSVPQALLAIGSMLNDTPQSEV